MDAALLLISLLLVLLLLACIGLAWKHDNAVRSLRKDVDQLKALLEKRQPPFDLVGIRERLQECDARYEHLHTSFMKILVPIRQNAEDIDTLDDDLARLQKLYEELKKREETNGSPPAAA